MGDEFRGEEAEEVVSESGSKDGMKSAKDGKGRVTEECEEEV